MRKKNSFRILFQKEIRLSLNIREIFSILIFEEFSLFEFILPEFCFNIKDSMNTSPNQAQIDVWHSTENQVET